METPEIMLAKVSQKGWVVIPAALRKRYGLKPGTLVEIREENGQIVILPKISDPVENLYGKLANEKSLTKALIEERAMELAHEEAKIRTR